MAGEEKLVSFFYPQDGSHNCTKEACYFRHLSDVFEEADAVLIGNIKKTPGYTLQILNF